MDLFSSVKESDLIFNFEWGKINKYEVRKIDYIREENYLKFNLYNSATNNCTDLWLPIERKNTYRYYGFYSDLEKFKEDNENKLLRAKKKLNEKIMSFRNLK